MPSNERERIDALDEEKMSLDLSLLVDTNNVPETYLPNGPIYKTFLGLDKISDDYTMFYPKVIIKRLLIIINEL